MFDPEKFGEEMGAVIREAVAPLLKRIADLESQASKAVDVPAEIARAVAAIPAPKDGKDAAPVDTDALVKAVLAQIPKPADGKDGEHGRDGKDGKDAAPVDAEAVIKSVLAQMPAPAPGKDGKDGLNGEKGADGLGLAGAMIDRDGALQITLTNGEVKSLGVVVGKNGADGSNGTDGKDGMSLEAFEIEYLEESHEICLKASANGRTKELRYPAGGIRPKGYWREGTRAKAGEAWVNDGSLWIAVKDCQSKPGLNDEGWIIAARKGKDGENGRSVKPIDTSPIKLKG